MVCIRFIDSLSLLASCPTPSDHLSSPTRAVSIFPDLVVDSRSSPTASLASLRAAVVDGETKPLLPSRRPSGLRSACAPATDPTDEIRLVGESRPSTTATITFYGKTTEVSPVRPAPHPTRPGSGPSLVRIRTRRGQMELSTRSPPVYCKWPLAARRLFWGAHGKGSRDPPSQNSPGVPHNCPQAVCSFF